MVSNPAEPLFADLDFDRWRLFATEDLDEARDLCARVFNPHRLCVAGRTQRLRSKMEHIPFGGASLNRLTWGAPVVVDPDRLGTYYLLSIPVRGSADFHHGGQTIQVSPRCAGLVSATPRFHFSASADFQQIVVRLERPAVERAWSALAGRPPQASIDFACGLPIGTQVWSAIEPALGLMTAAIGGRFDPMGLPHLAARVEDHLLTTLLLQQPHSLHAAPVAAPTGPAARLQRRAEEWMRDHLDEPITVLDVARACGVSVRSLQAGFQRVRGIGPMHWLRQERLSAVRAALLAACEDRPSIAQTALRWGFTHLGEFSRAYRSTFGERPRDTLARRS